MIRSLLKAVPMAVGFWVASVPFSHAFADEDKPAVRLDLAALKKQLESRDAGRIGSALDAIEKAEGANAKAAPLLESFLRRGSTVQLLERALEVTGSLEQESSSAAVAPYARHRVPKVRRAAVKALLLTKGPIAVKTLRSGLRSKDAIVRGISASGLGELGAKEALPDLFRAFDHRVGEAATSIGQLCNPAECEKFLDRLTRFPLDIMTGGLDQMLFRDPKEFKDEHKLEIVGRLRELGTAEAASYLADVADRWPEDWSERVKKAAEQASKQSGGGG